MRKLFLIIALSLVFLFLTSFQSFAECKGDFDCDEDVDGSDLAVFAAGFGRTDCGPCDVTDSLWQQNGSDIYYNDGYVGIGTGSPTDKLTVVGTISGKSASGHGVYGATAAREGYGVYGEASGLSGRGVHGEASGTFGRGVYGHASSELAVGGYFKAAGREGYGVYGEASNTGTGINYGVCGRAFGTSGRGVHGEASGVFGLGVYGSASGVNGYAGYFYGKVNVTGYLSKSGGGFQIDHPLEPDNKYLNHSFVESPDMMNMYNGNVVLNHKGEAWVELPEWFETLNKDFRYQLTCIGAFAQVYIAQKIADNRFKIAGGEPEMEISWQVTGIRKDPWANDNRILVEEGKTDKELGYYLHPKPYGQPEEKSIEWARDPKRMKRMKEEREKQQEVTS